MRNKLLIFILLFISNFCFAQQKIVFEQITPTFINQIKREYILPKSVTCTFKNGTKQRLVLERINGDSLIFQKYYNQTQNFDCVFSTLKKIKIHKNGENFLCVLFAAFTITTTAFVSIAIINNHPPSDAGDPSLLYSSFFTVTSIFPFAGAVITAASFPKTYKTNKWKLYAN